MVNELRELAACMPAIGQVSDETAKADRAPKSSLRFIR
jgi:hypothetical protein